VKKPNTGSTVFRGRQLLPTRPRPNNSQTQAALVLQKINTIYDAIRQNHQIIIQYGVYQEIHNTIELVSDPNKSYVLNPYALFWSNGQYYLIATGIRTADTDQILHFRVDRILDISPMEKKETLSNGNTVTKKCPRADIPNSLKPYFKQNIFQADLYRSKHPLMSYSQNNKEEEIVLHCSETSLSVLVDAFGAKGHMVGRTILYQKKNINLPFPNGYTVKLQDADYNAVKRFCLQMQNDIYVLEPARLKAEIIDELQKKLNIYKSM
jgi:predicted DNA-binding transcriptional regulator YafY